MTTTMWTILLGVGVFWGVCSGSSSPSGALARISGSQRRDVTDRRRRPRLLVAGLLAGCGLCWVLAGKGMVAPGLLATAAVVSGLAYRLSLDSKRRQNRRERQLAVIELCDTLGAELRAGVPSDLAISRCCAHRSDWDPVVATVRLGGDGGEALRRAARMPGAEGLRSIAAGWQVAGRSGAGLANVLDRISVGLRADDEARSEVVASLGPPRATAKMLAVLPFIGLGLGTSMGARPVAFLLGTGPGLVCLLLGLVLTALGVVWVEQLATSAEV